MSSFLSQLIGQETGLVKQRISESLAKKMAKAQKKESKWRGLSSVLKTVANIALPGVGGAILGAAIDPIGRHFGAGARKSDIKASGDENIFGGRKAFKTARTGLQDAIDDYKQKNITNSILGYAGSELGGAALEKLGGGLKGAFTKGGMFSANPMDKGVGMSSMLEGGNAFADLQGTGFSMPSYNASSSIGMGSTSGVSPFSIANYEEGGEVKSSNPFRKSQESGEQWWNNLVSGRKRMSNLAPNLQKSISENLNKNIGSESVSNMLNRLPSQNLNISPLEQRGEDIFSSSNLFDSIQKVPESGLNLPEGVSQMSRYAEGGTHNLQAIIDSLMENPSDAKYLDDLGYTPEMLKNYASSKMPTFEQGGMVQKYQEGGQIRRMMPSKRETYTDSGGFTKTREILPAYPVWDTYEYDGINWKKTGTGLKTNPNLKTVTKAEMDKWRDEGRTENVGSSYMATQGEGINEFLRTPAVAAQINQARAGNAGAMENLVEMAKQMVPEYANMKNKDIRGALEKNLTHVDIYGQGYQDVLSSGQTTLEGLQTNVQGARAQASSGAATSGIRTGGGGFRGADSISENLYAQVGDTYSGMQKGIQDEFDESFGGFETSILGING